MNNARSMEEQKMEHIYEDIKKYILVDRLDS
mgnify:CR=1 FL=1